jgi:hypothetical protein
MTEPRAPHTTDAATARLRRRARRGLVAGYIHEISGRHRADAAAAAPARDGERAAPPRTAAPVLDAGPDAALA